MDQGLLENLITFHFRWITKAR